MTAIMDSQDTGRLSRRAILAGAAASLAAAPVARLGAQTPVASPVTRGGTYMTDARDRLRSLLALVPMEALGGPDPTSELFTWLDLQVFFHANGIDDPASVPEGLPESMVHLVSTDELFSHALIPAARDAVGFSVLDVHQVLVAGVPPDRVTIYAGGVDFASLAPVWEAAGYERKTGDHGDYWTLGEEGEPDFNLPGPLNTGSMNNVALLADDTAVFTRSYATLERVLAHHAEGEGASAADDADLNLLIDTLPSDTVNVMTLPGDAFRADTMVPENPGMEPASGVDDLLAESDDAVGPMPPLLLGMVAVTSGAVPALDGTPPVDDLHPRAVMAFLTGSEDDAEAAADVAFWRLQNMQSPTTGLVYSERFIPTNTPEDAVEGPVMVVEFGEDVALTGNWWKIVYMRDTWPFAWSEG